MASSGAKPQGGTSRSKASAGRGGRGQGDPKGSTRGGSGGLGKRGILKTSSIRWLDFELFDVARAVRSLSMPHPLTSSSIGELEYTKERLTLVEKELSQEKEKRESLSEIALCKKHELARLERSLSGEKEETERYRGLLESLKSELREAQACQEAAEVTTMGLRESLEVAHQELLKSNEAREEALREVRDLWHKIQILEAPDTELKRTRIALEYAEAERQSYKVRLESLNTSRQSAQEASISKLEAPNPNLNPKPKPKPKLHLSGFDLLEGSVEGGE